MSATPASPRPALSIYDGRTTHARFKPFEQSFAYRLFLIDIDIDRLDEADRTSSVFSVDNPNLFSFRTRDHGPKDGSPLRPWAETLLQEAGIDGTGCTLRLVTFPRHLFYKFAPISIWFAHAPDGALNGLIYEVNNTFGERHCYAAKVDGARDVHEADKAFHVSPFFDVSGRYRFTVRPPGERLDLVVDSLEGEERLHMANMKAISAPATTGAFLKAAVARPFATHGVTAAIHWEALKIWRRGAKYRSRPKPPENLATIAQPSRSVARTRTIETI